MVPLRCESGSFIRHRPVTARTFGVLSGRTETLKTKTGLSSIVAVTGVFSLHDELPEFRRNVLEMIGSL